MGFRFQVFDPANAPDTDLVYRTVSRRAGASASSLCLASARWA